MIRDLLDILETIRETPPIEWLALTTQIAGLAVVVIAFSFLAIGFAPGN